jgi:hypothetical protein
VVDVLARFGTAIGILSISALAAAAPAPAARSDAPEPVPSACPVVRPDDAAAGAVARMQFSPRADSVEPDGPHVNIVYLVPSDQAVRPDYVRALGMAGRSIQAWYARQTGGKTFRLASPQVWVVPLPHEAAWYSTNDAGTKLFTQFWANTLNDAFPLTGGRFNDPENIWAYYIDADPICGQCGGCGTSGVLVIAKNDLRGLTGEPRIVVCEDKTPDQGPLGRWIGGLGHELGHAFGLPHPPGCNDGSQPCDYYALMWNGFRVYPNTYLREDDKERLSTSPFFSEIKLRLRPSR